MSFKYLSSGGINNNIGISMSGPFTAQGRQLTPAIAYGDVAAFSGMEHYSRGSFNTGTGYMITQNGNILYDANTAGSGVLENLLLVNRGVNTFYFGINSDTMDINLGTPLASGESWQVQDDMVRKVWAITVAGNTTIVSAQGMYRFNENAV